jgi:hypothetical protein
MHRYGSVDWRRLCQKLCQRCPVGGPIPLLTWAFVVRQTTEAAPCQGEGRRFESGRPLRSETPCSGRGFRRSTSGLGAWADGSSVPMATSRTRAFLPVPVRSVPGFVQKCDERHRTFSAWRANRHAIDKAVSVRDGSWAHCT